MSYKCKYKCKLEQNCISVKYYSNLNLNSYSYLNLYLNLNSYSYLYLYLNLFLINGGVIMQNPRQIALEILIDVHKNKAYSNLSINKILKKYHIEDSRLIREIVYGVIENKIYLDYIIGKLVKTGIKKLKSEVHVILRMGLYQMIFLDSMPPYAVVNESVKLTKKHSYRHVGFVNAVLRNYERSKDEIVLPDKKKDIVQYLSVKYSYEPWMVKEWLKVFDEKFTEDLLKTGNDTPELIIRVNTLKTNVDFIKKELIKQDIIVKEGQYVSEALRVKGSNLIDNNEWYNSGYYQVQDESSMLAVQALDPRPNDMILDVCSAPGGKSIYAAELMKNKGKIIARDIHEHKLKLLKNRAQKHGIDIIETQVFDGLKEDKSLYEKMDKVLVDVPCSGFGVIRRKPEIKYNRDKEELKKLVEIQYQILHQASKYVKNNGTLIYSTCTISKYENMDVVREFLKNHDHFTIDIFENKVFKSFNVTEGVLHLFPNVHGTDGFFICKMKKRNDN